MVTHEHESLKRRLPERAHIYMHFSLEVATHNHKKRKLKKQKMKRKMNILVCILFQILKRRLPFFLTLFLSFY